MTNPENPARVTVTPEDDKMTIEALRLVVKELSDKIQHLIDWADSRGMLEDHSYTFPDGDVFKAQDVE